MIYIGIIIIIILIFAYILLQIYAFFKLLILPKDGKRIRHFLVKNKMKYNEAKKIVEEYKVRPALLAEIDRANGVEKYAGIGITVFIDFYNKNKKFLFEKYNYNFDELDR